MLISANSIVAGEGRPLPAFVTPMNSIIRHDLWATVLAGRCHLALNERWPDWPQLALDRAITNAARNEVRWFAATRMRFADAL